MSAFKHESADTLDIDRYLNFDHSVSPSPLIHHSTTAAPAAVSTKGKAVATPDYFTPVHQRPVAPPPPPQPQTFAGPSHQYDLHKQQTSLPIGALADSLAASRLPYGPAFSAPSRDYSTPSFTSSSNMNSIDELFDFGASVDRHSSLSGSSDMDVDFDVNGADDIFADASGSGFVDPHALESQDDDSPTPTRAEIVRIWPGMHTQQAALAKQQQQQQAAVRQQKTRETHRTQPVPAPQSRSTAPAANRKSDPLVEERISRLLNQMRHSNVPSQDAALAAQGNMSHSRSKKDEADMDEDERLLASEAGKKLSSKERRQLRNKVSARAFRSRRKEYISQLEGEISSKSSEADELRAENEALRSENTRLTDLTRMLLSSPAFSTFLNDLSANPSASIPAQPQPQQTSSRNAPEPPKDLPAHQPVTAQDTAQVGMALMPETTMDFSASANAIIEPINTGSWGVGMDFGYNAQVFAVTEIPDGPAVDTGMLSGKSSSSEAGFTPKSSAKDEIPVIEEMPAVEEPTATKEDVCNDVELDASDPAFALFIDTPAQAAQNPVADDVPEYCIFGSIQPEKAFARFDLVVESDVSAKSDSPEEVDAATMIRFVNLCASMDEAAGRLAEFTARL